MAALNRWYILHHYKHKKNSPSDIWEDLFS